MEKGFLKIIAVVAIATMFGCSGNSPESVAEKFLKAMNKMDYDGAKKYGTDETGKMLDMLSGFMKMMPDSSKKETNFEIISLTAVDNNFAYSGSNCSAAEKYLTSER